MFDQFLTAVTLTALEIEYETTHSRLSIHGWYADLDVSARHADIEEELDRHSSEDKEFEERDENFYPQSLNDDCTIGW